MNDTTIDDPIVPGWSGASAVSGRSIPSLKRDVKAKRFPPPLELGPNRIGWRRSWIEEWLESRPRRHYALLGEAQGRAPMEAGEPQPRFVYRATPEGETAPPRACRRLWRQVAALRLSPGIAGSPNPPSEGVSLNTFAVALLAEGLGERPNGH
jgi:predicted DNA-binding transcriptional regulator AlpA